MELKKNILALILARGGSKRLPRKNVLDFAGKPMIAWTIDAAKRSAYVNRVIVSTDDDEIAAVSNEYDAEVLRRPIALATDTATSFEVVVHALDALKEAQYNPEILVLLQPTSPLRVSDDIDQAVAIFDANQKSTVISVSELPPATAWGFTTQGKHLVPILGWDWVAKSSQEVPHFYGPDGAIYVLSPDTLRARGRILGPPLVGYHIPPERSIDIDTKAEFEEAEIRYKHLYGARTHHSTS